MNFVMNRNHTLVSVKGHTIQFIKNKPTLVPKPLHLEAIAAGAQPAEDQDEVEFEETPTITAPPDDSDTRAEMLKMALMDIAKRDDSNDFTANGTPKASAVRKILDYTVSAEEIGLAWTELKQADPKE